MERIVALGGVMGGCKPRRRTGDPGGRDDGDGDGDEDEVAAVLSLSLYVSLLYGMLYVVSMSRGWP